MAVKYECPKCGKKYIDWGAEKLGFQCADCKEELLEIGLESKAPAKAKPSLKRKKAAASKKKATAKKKKTTATKKKTTATKKKTAASDEPDLDNADTLPDDAESSDPVDDAPIVDDQ